MMNGRWESRTPKGFYTSTVFKTVAVANRLDLPLICLVLFIFI